MVYFSRGIFFLALASMWGCEGTYVLAEKRQLDAASQCLAVQLNREQLVLEQQQQFHEVLTRLEQTLGKPLQVSTTECQAVAGPPPSIPAGQAQATAPAHNKQIVGEIEKAWLPHLDMVLTARIDTGATTSSLDARDIQPFERDGERWVRFTVVEGDVSRTFERRRVRKARIIQSNTEEAERRPVIELYITIGSVSQLAEFTLSDRSHLDYSVLIGRNVLRDVMVVDVSGRHLAPLDTAGDALR